MTRVVIALALFFSLTGSALASRPPTRTERAAITNALPSYVKRLPTTCVTVRTRVANNGRYARAWLQFRQADDCGLTASNGQWFLRKTARGWRVVYVGSDPPPCRLGVPRDLTTCIRG